MLVDFEVENFRSYREAKRFSLVASSSEELPRNLIDTDSGLKLVRSTALYGPNASGKSNLLRAMDCVATLLDFPVKWESPSLIALTGFALDRMSASKPCRFQARFLSESILYDYSISVRPRIVEEERLVAYPRGRPQIWFHRIGTAIELNATHLKGQKQSTRSQLLPETPFLGAAVANGLDGLAAPR